MGSFYQAYVQADLFGKLIFFALFLLSCGCWVFLLKKYWSLKQIKLGAHRFKKLAELHKEEILNLKTMSKNPFCTLYNVLKEQTLAVLDKNRFFDQNHGNYLSGLDVEFLESHLETTIATLKGKVEKNLFILSTTKTLAPFLGLLGTVWGILVSFGELQAGHSVTSNTVILGGLSTALTTTVLGLLIAIPALVAHSYMKSLCNRFTLEMVDFSQFLLSTVELQYRKVDLQRQ